MESTGQARETRLNDDNTYDVIENESSEMVDEETAQLKEQLAQARDQSLRTLAEFDNYRRRTRQELSLAEQAGKRDVLLALLDVMDDFDRALLHTGEPSNALTEGLQLVRRRFNDVLLSNGVAPFDSEGQPFDPMVHEAISVIEGDDGSESGTVYAEEQRGYLMNGELLRPARVVVLR
ncbi:MAG TPA: nucleotide exchange factor GrpE [Pyrinomonadaceae bacterium]|nr:nucleotide exchange factor GrpE [Pyrinomonadaceae bacterium]